VLAEATGESDKEADSEIGRTGAVQPEIGQELSAAGGFSAFLDILISQLGESVPARMVYPDNAIKDRADEESCSDASQP
jgi:hypothetical protein